MNAAMTAKWPNSGSHVGFARCRASPSSIITDVKQRNYETNSIKNIKGTNDLTINLEREDIKHLAGKIFL